LALSEVQNVEIVAMTVDIMPFPGLDTYPSAKNLNPDSNRSSMGDEHPKNRASAHSNTPKHQNLQEPDRPNSSKFGAQGQHKESDNDS
jgi:hypothetical protein